MLVGRRHPYARSRWLGAGGTAGGNAQWGAALNLSTGDATFFQTTGRSSGLGADIGAGFGFQTGSSNDLVAPTASAIAIIAFARRSWLVRPDVPPERRVR